MKNLNYKKVVFIVICVLGLASISSCRSTAGSCGLAETTNHQQVLQIDVT